MLTRFASSVLVALSLLCRADDTALVQGLIDSSRIIPAGKYTVGQLLVSSGKTVQGVGWDTILSARTNIGQHLLLAQSCSNAVIRDLHLIGNSLSQNGGVAMTNLAGARHGVALLGASECTVSNVLAEDFDGDGFYLGRNLSDKSNPETRNCIIENCVARRNVRNGIMMSHGVWNILRFCILEENQVGMLTNSPKYSPAVYNSAELDLEPNRISTNPLIWEQVNSNTVEQCSFLRGPTRGIQFAKFDSPLVGNAIRSNIFLNFGDRAISIFCGGASSNVIQGNIFLASSPTASVGHIRLVGGVGTAISSNKFLGGIAPVANSKAIGIEPYGTNTLPGLVISGNLFDFSNASGDGASVYLAKGVTLPAITNNVLVGAHFDIR